MKKQNHNLPSWVPDALRDDPRKLGFLGLLLVIFSFVMIRTFTSSGPSTASAAVQTVRDLDPITTPIPANNGYRSTEQIASELPAQKWLREPVGLVSRDLFAVRLEDYPKLSDKASGNSTSQVVGTWDDNEKSLSFEVDQKRKRDALIEALQLEASKLKLQSTMMGNEPRAILDGDVVKEGAVFRSGASDGEFKVVKISSRSIVIERDGIRLEIRMPD